MIVCALDLVTIGLAADMTTGIVFAQRRLRCVLAGRLHITELHQPVLRTQCILR